MSRKIFVIKTKSFTIKYISTVNFSILLWITKKSTEKIKDNNPNKLKSKWTKDIPRYNFNQLNSFKNNKKKTKIKSQRKTAKIKEKRKE